MKHSYDAPVLNILFYHLPSGVLVAEEDTTQVYREQGLPLFDLS